MLANISVVSVFVVQNGSQVYLQTFLIIILIVDDDPIIQELLAAHVEQSENIPRKAGSLHQAFNLTETTEFDLRWLS